MTHSWNPHQQCNIYQFFFYPRIMPLLTKYLIFPRSIINGWILQRGVPGMLLTLNFFQTLSMTTKLWDVLSTITKSLPLSMPLLEYLWEDSILSTDASNSANNSLDSVKRPNVGKANCSPFIVNDWTTGSYSHFAKNHHLCIQWQWSHLSLVLQL